MITIQTTYRTMRRTAALCMLAIYMLIACAPFTTFAMHSRHVASAITQECVGDCSICGCSLESRATNSCCCSKKRAQQAALQHDDADEPECCKKTSKPAETIIKSCACPCSDGKSIAFFGSGSSDTMPFSFSHRAPTPPGKSHFATRNDLPFSRTIAPPDPPPQN